MVMNQMISVDRLSDLDQARAALEAALPHLESFEMHASADENPDAVWSVLTVAKLIHTIDHHRQALEDSPDRYFPPRQ